MSLTKADLKAIKTVVNEVIDERVDPRFVSIETRLDIHDKRFDNFDKRFDGYDQRFDGYDRRFDSYDHRFDRIENTIQTLTTSTAQQFDNIVGQLDRIHEEVSIIKDYVLDHDYRITKLEKRLA